MKIKVLFFKLSLFFKRLNFLGQVHINKKILSRNGNMFCYPLLVSLNFDEDKYWRRFLNGHSVKNSLIAKAKIMISRMERHAKREPSNEVWNRYNRLIDWHKEKLANEEFENDLREAANGDQSIIDAWNNPEKPFNWDNVKVVERYGNKQ